MSIKNLLFKYRFIFSPIFFTLIGLRIFLFQLPLLKNLDLEIAIVFSLIFSFLSGFGGIWLLNRKEKVSTILKLNLILISSLFVVFLLLEFLLFDCPLTEGILFFPIFVISSSLFSLALSSITYSFGKIRSVLFLFFIYFILILYSLTAYYFEPQLFLFNPLMIFFPGLVYNEVFTIETRMVIYSLGISIASISILIAKILDENERRSIKLNKSHFYILPVLIFSLMFILSDNLRLSTSQNFLSRNFPTKIDEKDFEIFIEDKNISEREKQLLIYKTQFHYQWLTQLFGYKTNKVQIFIFKSNSSKKNFLGDEVADFTKPWLNQIFVTEKSFDQTIKHELAHIFLGERTKNIFKVAAGFNLGLIEGGAVAVEWEWLENIPAYYTSMIIRFSPQIEIQSFFNNYTFATQRSSLSYLISGAFCRYLIDNYGLGSFLKFYNDGDFTKVYGLKLSDEINNFLSHLNSFQFSNDDSLKFKVIFGGGTFFEKKCPRAISRIRLKARKFMVERLVDRAEEIFKKIYDRTSDTDAFMNLIRAKFYQKKFNEIIREYNASLHHNTINGFSSIYLKIYYSLSLAKIGESEKAKKIISDLKQLDISSNWNSYFDLLLFLISKPELIDRMINKNFYEFIGELRQNYPNETAILVNDIERLNSSQVEEVIKKYESDFWIYKDCFYRYIMLGNFAKAISLIKKVETEFFNLNDAEKYQLELMRYILQKFNKLQELE